jgi:alpha-tubulin suppressor-like RCC1 family protein
MKDIAQISCNLYNTRALTKSGDLYEWGLVAASDYATGNFSTTPMLFMNSVSQISCGAYHSLAVLLDGSLVSWGSNSDGQLGVPGAVTSNEIRKVQWTAQEVGDGEQGKRKDERTKILCYVGCGWNFSYVMDQYGVLYTWGAPFKVCRNTSRDSRTPQIFHEDMKFFLPLDGRIAQWWGSCMQWLFLGKSDKESRISEFPIEVIFHVAKVINFI